MPRSKRDKKISLTKTTRKGLAWKQHIVEDIRNCLEKYPAVFVFSVQNMRNNLLKDLRQEMKKDSRFFFGKNRIMQLGLGRSKDEEIEPGLYKLAKRIQGQCGLLFTHKSKDEILKWSEDYSAIEYARGGFTATQTVKLDEGPLEDFSHAIEPHLRSLGMPTKLEKGIVSLCQEYTVCEKGKVLTPEQARILKLIAIPMATFKLKMKCVWSKKDGYESLTTGKEEDEGNSDDDEQAADDVQMENDGNESSSDEEK